MDGDCGKLVNSVGKMGPLYMIKQPFRGLLIRIVMTLSKMTEHFFFVGSMNKLDFSIYGEIRQVGMVRVCGLFFALRGFEMF